MISRYITDAIFIVGAVSIAFVLAGKPGDIKTPVTHTAPESSEVKVKAEINPVVAAIKEDAAAIDRRNIFAASGSYKDTKQILLPENPYVLIGVIHEDSGMKALFREYTGAVVGAAAGQRMIDGFKVIAMDTSQVILGRGSEKKTFDVYGSSVSQAAQSDAKNFAGQKPMLLAILEGRDKKAVFRDQGGHLSILGMQHKLPDGSVITHIDSHSVKLKNGKDEKEIMLFAEALQQKPDQAVQTISPQDKETLSPLRAHRRHHPQNINADEQKDQGDGT